MSSTTDYNELLPVFADMKPTDTLTPNIPIDVFVQEAENLYHWCVDDQPAPALLDMLLVANADLQSAFC